MSLFIQHSYSELCHYGCLVHVQLMNIHCDSNNTFLSLKANFDISAIWDILIYQFNLTKQRMR